MKKVVMFGLIIIGLFGISGCATGKEQEMAVKSIKATTNTKGDIVIQKENLTTKATFLSYEVEDVTIGLIAVLGTDGKERVVLNTCQACSPSPNAYFVQEGSYFECQNCGTKFHVDDIGKQQGGCNPAPIEGVSADDETITIKTQSIIAYKNKFKNWNGPKA